MRPAVERWGVVQSLVRRLDAVVQAHAYLDLGERRGERSRDTAHRVELEMERIAARVEVEAVRVTVEAAEQYIVTRRRGRGRVKP